VVAAGSSVAVLSGANRDEALVAAVAAVALSPVALLCERLPAAALPSVSDLLGGGAQGGFSSGALVAGVALFSGASGAGVAFTGVLPVLGLPGA